MSDYEDNWKKKLVAGIQLGLIVLAVIGIIFLFQNC
jgi:hypothetical protein